MPNPGSNLLKQALTVIAPQSVTYYEQKSRSINDVGQWETCYKKPATIRGSLQAVDKKLYYLYGLDLQKTYAIFYTLDDIFDVQRDISNDQIEYDGKRYQCESNTEWYAQDGWKGVLCCLITADGIDA